MLNISSKKIKNQMQEDQLYSLRTLKTPSAGKILARWILALSLIFILTLFLPWQQNIRGKGTVTAFAPSNRPQTIETAIPGRIASWKVREGDYVEAGDTILTLSEIKEKFFDPNLLLRLEEQISAKEDEITSKERKVAALTTRIGALEDGFVVKLQQARNKLTQTQLKLESDSVDFEAEKIRFKNFENQFHRNEQLYDLGNISLTKFQDAETKFQEAKMKLISTENTYLENKAELANATVDITGVKADYQDKISKAESELSETRADLFVSTASLAKLQNEYANMSIRNQQYQVLAPQDGYVVRALQAGIGQTIKEGEAVATIMPQSPDIAVEMFVKAMDVPLIAKGRKVRIEFDGWPALQFSGWPSVSVGTFGGVVTVIDYVNSQNGDFRILVVPDSTEDSWPAQLRLGSGTNGWVMLDNVPIWYEIWRQLNGFPPSLEDEPKSREGFTADKSGDKS